MMAVYSGNPLYKKLGIKQNQEICVINQPADYIEWLQEVPKGVVFRKLEEVIQVPFIHLFCENESELHNLLPIIKPKMEIHGAIWVSWIKKASKNYAWTITDLDVRNLGLHLGLVDVKVCAVSEDWSGLKFMYRLEDRKKMKANQM